MKTPAERIEQPAVSAEDAPRAIGSESSYSPERGIHMSYKATTYEYFHERAHMVQHRLQCAPWRWWKVFNGIRLIGYLVTIWLEHDAMVRARYAMEWEGRWTRSTKKEASTKFRSYITRKEVS